MPSPSSVKPRPVRTAAPDRSIWRDLREDTFRRNVVKLAKACDQVGWKADFGSGLSPAIVDQPVIAPRSASHDSSYELPLEVECRLSGDMAFIASTEAGAHKVTAAYVEESISGNEITLRLAANSGVEERVEEALLHIWDTIEVGVTGVASSRSKDAQNGQRGSRQYRLLQDVVLDKIVRLNYARIRSRIHKALGYAPEHSAPHGRSVKHTDALLKIITSGRKQKAGHNGHAFLTNLENIHREMLSIHKTHSRVSAVEIDESIVDRLKKLTKLCFSLTNKREDGQIASFQDILGETGLNAKKLFSENSLLEVEKIGSYRRVSRSLLQDCIDFCRRQGRPPRLRIERLTPYEATRSKVSSKLGVVECHVHAEIQLLCEWLMLPSQDRRPPRVIGASKQSCFLCFLCISCCGGLLPPRPHGRIFDQWTMPDLAGFDDGCVQTLRRTISLMNRKVMEMSKLTYSPRLWPITSRVHLTELPPGSVVSTVTLSDRIGQEDVGQGLPNTVAGQNESGVSTCSSVTTVIPPVTGEFGGRESAASLRSTASVEGSVIHHDSDSTAQETDGVLLPGFTHRFSVGGIPPIELLLEVEAPCKAVARLSHLVGDKRGDAEALDLSGLAPGEELRMARNEGDSDLCINLCNGTGATECQLKLTWVK